MALTAAIKTELYQFFAIAFDAAPGLTYMDQLTQAVDAGMTVPQIVEVFTSKLQFTSVYPESATSAEFAAKLIENVVGTSATDAAKAEAVADVEGALAAGWTRGQVIYQIFSNLAAKPADDATWGGTSKMMANQVAVAQYATEVQLVSTANLYELRALIAEVTDSTDVSTPAAIEAVIATGVAASTPGQTFSLTTGTDVPTMTAGNDTVTGGTAGQLGDTSPNADVIVDASSTDSDVLNATVTVNNLKPTLVKIETVNIAGQFATTGFDLANTSGTKTLNLTTGIVNGTATVVGAKVSAAEKIVAGTNIGALAVTANATDGTGGSLAIDAGSARTVTLAGAAPAATDTVALTVNGDITVNHTSAIEQLTIDTTKAAVVTLDTVGTSLAVTGVGNVTVKTAIANLTAETITKSLTSGNLIVNATGNAAADYDFSKIAADEIKFAGTIGTNAVTVASGATVSLDIDVTDTTAAGTDGFVGAAGTALTNTINVKTKTDQAGLDFTNFGTVNIVSSATQVTGIDATFAKLVADTTATVNLSGTNDVKVTLGTAKVFDASTLVGKLDYTQTAAADGTVKGGSGANAITLKGTTHTNTYIGQNGGDTVGLATTTGTGTVTTGSGNDTITANGLTTGTVNLALGDGANSVTSTSTIATTGTLNVTSGSGTDSITANSATTGTIAGSLGAGDDTVSATGLTSGVLSVDLGAGDDAVTLGTAAITGTINVTGGEGTDVLKVGASFDGKGATISLSDVEQIQLTAAGSATFSTAQLSGKTFTLKGSGTATDFFAAAEQTNAGATIDLSTLTLDRTVAASIVGVSITGGNGADIITGTAGKDTISGGTGADSIIFASTAALNNADTLTVVAGAGGDILNFKNFLSAGSVAQNSGIDTAIVAYSDAATGDVAINNKVVLLNATTAATAAEVDTAGEVAALIDGSGDTFSIAANGKAVVVAGSTDAGAAASAYIYFVHDMNGDGLVSGTNEVKLVGTIATYDIDTLTTANFAFA